MAVKYFWRSLVRHGNQLLLTTALLRCLNSRQTDSQNSQEALAYNVEDDICDFYQKKLEHFEPDFELVFGPNY